MREWSWCCLLPPLNSQVNSYCGMIGYVFPAQTTSSFPLFHQPLISSLINKSNEIEGRWGWIGFIGEKTYNQPPVNLMNEIHQLKGQWSCATNPPTSISINSINHSIYFNWIGLVYLLRWAVLLSLLVSFGCGALRCGTAPITNQKTKRENSPTIRQFNHHSNKNKIILFFFGELNGAESAALPVNNSLSSARPLGRASCNERWVCWMGCG